MHNFTKSTSSTDLQRPHESYSWPFKKLSNKYFRASRGGRGCFVARLFSPTLSRFFLAPAAGDTGTPLFNILDPPLCIVHKHKTLPHSNPQSIPVPFPSQPPSPFQCHTPSPFQCHTPSKPSPAGEPSEAYNHPGHPGALVVPGGPPLLPLPPPRGH